MKKTLFLFVFVLLAITLTGCSSKGTTVRAGQYPWSVFIAVQYDLGSAATDDAVTDLRNFVDTTITGYSADTDVNQYQALDGSYYLQVIYMFDVNKDYDNYKNFLRFFRPDIAEENLDDAATIVTVSIKNTGLFYERTQTYANPLNNVSVSPRLDALNVKVDEVGLFDVSGAAQLVYLFPSDYRRTSVNSDQTINDKGSYTYVFYSDKDIVIFDRMPNLPIWYGIAFGATGLFMIAVFLFAKMSRKR